MPLRHYETSGTMGTTYSSAGAEWEAAELCGAVLPRRCIVPLEDGAAAIVWETFKEYRCAAPK